MRGIENQVFIMNFK